LTLQLCRNSSQGLKMPRFLYSVGLLLLLAGVNGCKGEIEVRADPETERKLKNCEQSLEESKKLRQELEAQLANTQLGNEGEVLVAVKGDLPQDAIMKITGGKGPNGRTTPRDPVGNAKDEELYKEFISSVRKSRGSIEQCYRRALKNDARLQARTVTVKISVSYRTTGQVSQSGSNPRISDAFDKCMEGVARAWNLPAMPKQATFQYPLTLTPET
jgi:hypothetical protein